MPQSKSTSLVEIIRKAATAPATSQASDAPVIFRKNNFQSSTKLDALVHSLRMNFLVLPVLKMSKRLSEKLRVQDPCFRAVIFSQFTSFLDLIQVALDRERLDHYRFDGTMDIKKKSTAISEFKSSSRRPKILVISLKAGGVGLNVCQTTFALYLYI